MIRFAPEDVAAARRGSRAALDRLVRAAERPVHRLALRMLADPADAEDATQEILIRIVTHLGTLREEGAAGAWAFRLACRHLERERRRGRVEALRLTFTGFAEDLETGLAPLPEDGAAPGLTRAETALAVEEVKAGCTLAMLTCLGRPQRIAYILGEIFEMTDAEASAALGVTPAAFRQRLKRARGAVAEFVTARCGIASEAAACSCPARVAPALAQGRVRAGEAGFGSDGRKDLAALRLRVRALEGARAAAALMRDGPEFSSRAAELAMEAVG